MQCGGECGQLAAVTFKGKAAAALVPDTKHPRRFDFLAVGLQLTDAVARLVGVDGCRRFGRGKLTTSRKAANQTRNGHGQSKAVQPKTITAATCSGYR